MSDLTYKPNRKYFTTRMGSPKPGTFSAEEACHGVDFCNWSDLLWSAYRKVIAGREPNAVFPGGETAFNFIPGSTLRKRCLT